MSVERRWQAVELRQRGRALSGKIVRYGDVADMGSFREQFAPGAFDGVASADVVLNAMHDRQRPLARSQGGGLILADGSQALTMVAVLPETREANDTLELVRAKVLRGLSAEFHPLRERMEGDTRVIERAKLVGVGVVDEPAYPASQVEARRFRGGASGRVPFKKKLDCQCHKGKACSVEIEDIELPTDTDVLAVSGDYKGAIASVEKGSMRLSKTAEGLTVELSEAAMKSPAGRDIAAMAKTVPVYARPIFDQDASDFVETDDVATYRRMKIKAILLGATDRNGGWPEVKIMTSTPEPRRRWLWQ